MGIVASELEIQIGARTLLTPTNFHIQAGDRIGLVGHNGAGKTTLVKTIVGDLLPTSGKVTINGTLGYLPQSTHAANPDQLVLDRILSARDIAVLLNRLRRCEKEMTSENPHIMEKALNKYNRLQNEFDNAGGYSAQAEATKMADSLHIDQKMLEQPLQDLSGGQRRRIELARILFSQADTLILDEPTNHLDADSILWLKNYLQNYHGGFLVISHSTPLLDETVNRVWHLDSSRAEIDMYNIGWKAYIKQRQQDAIRLRREREVAEKKADRLLKMGAKLHAKATKAVAAQNMIRRAQKLLEETSPVEDSTKVADIRFPEPDPCGKTPLFAKNISQWYGSDEIFTDINLAIDKGSRTVILGLNGAGKTTFLRILAGQENPTAGEIDLGYGARIGYFAQEHDTLDMSLTVVENLRHASPDLDDTQVRSVLGSFLFSGDDVDKPVSVLSGGEKTRLALATLVTSRANVLLLDEPTNNLDPESREQILNAISCYTGAIVLVTHDKGAVQSLRPEHILLLPDGDEDLWNDGYLDLVSEA